MEIILVIILILFFSGCFYLIGYSSKKIAVQKIDDKEKRKYLLELEELKSIYYETEFKFKGLQNEVSKIEKEIIIKSNSLNQLTDSYIQKAEESSQKYAKALKEKTDLESVAYKEKIFDTINKEYTMQKAKNDEDIKNLQEKYLLEKEKYEGNLCQLKETVNVYQQRILAIEEDFQRREAMKNQEEFFKVCLKNEDLQDIEELKKVVPHLNNKDVLSRLIYEAYYKNPMTDMFNRVAKNKPCGIYKITNTLNGMIYIGKSVEIAPRRWSEHIKSSLNIGTISHTKIHDAINKDGINNFTFEILEECDKDKLAEREKYWISFYNSDVYGYNIRKG